MTVECGMCGEETPVTADILPHLDAGVLCVECQDYTTEYLHPNEGGT